MRRANDLLLLLAAAACLFFGGGVGCDPELDGVDLKPAYVLTDPGDKTSQDWYARFGGKKAPGNGLAQIPYPVAPGFGIEARVGVLDPSAVGDSADAQGCIGFRQSGGAVEYAICATYLTNPSRTRVFSNLSNTEFDCDGASFAILRLEDDGMTAVASYKCPTDANFATLDDDVSEWDEGEKWFAFLAANGVAKGAEVGIDELQFYSGGPFEDSDEGDIAFATFDALRAGIDAFLDVEAGESATSNGTAMDALLNGAIAQKESAGAFPGTDAAKLLAKAQKSAFKLVFGLYHEGEEKYEKSFPKTAATIADTLGEMEPSF
jgi:hypothetical protein